MASDAQEIQRERRRLVHDLPPIGEVLRASLFERAVRCGKASCHCADQDDPGHLTTYVGLSLPGGRTSQVSLPRRLVPVAEAWIGNYKRWLEAVERISAFNHELLRQRRVDASGRPRRRR